MADSPNTPLEDAVIRILHRNEEAGVGPVSVRALAREMVRITEGEQAANNHAKVESRRRNLRRYLTAESGYVEETRLLMARALGVEPAEIPHAPSRAGLQQRVADLERETREIRSRLDRLLENT